MNSIKHKIETKQGKYSRDGKKIQDVLGLRIVFYFISDIKPFCNALQQNFQCVDISDSEADFRKQKDQCRRCDRNPDIKFEELFRPVRLNLVFRMSDDIKGQFLNELQQLPPEIAELIDSTYEVQLRSVLSEGWHEVEHDLRYKYSSDWENYETEYRILNGIYASLESHEYSMEMLFEKKARLHYIGGAWEAMLRNHLRLRLVGSTLSDKLKRLFDADPEAAKPFLRVDRDRLIGLLFNIRRTFPISYDNMIFLINRIQKTPNEEIRVLETRLTSEILDGALLEK